MSQLGTLPIVVNTIAKLKTIPNLQVNDVVYVKERQSNFITKKSTLDTYVTLTSDGAGSTIDDRLRPQSVNFGTEILIGEKFYHIFRVVEEADVTVPPTEQRLMSVNGFSHYIGVRKLAGGTLQARSGGSLTYTVKDENGINLDPLNLPYNTWIIQEATMTANVTFDSTGITHGYYNYGMTYDVKEFGIKGEIFGMDEATGNITTGDNGSIYEYFDADSTAPLGTITWGTDHPNNDMDIIEAGTAVLEIEKPEDGFLSPEQLGYDNSLNIDNTVVNDVQPYLERIKDLFYNIRLSGANYNIETTFVMDDPIQVQGVGSASYTTSFYGEDEILNMQDNNNTTLVYSTSDIDFFELRFNSITIDRILTSSAGISAYTKSHYLLNVNYEMTNINLINLRGEGNYDDLIAGVGRGGNMFRVNADDKIAGIGWCYGVNIRNSKASHMNNALLVPEKGVLWNEGENFMNTWYVDLQGDGCKSVLNVRNIPNSTFMSNKSQDRNILPVGEEDRYPFYVDCAESIIDAFIYDSGFGGTLGSAPYKHVNKYLYCPHGTSMLIGNGALTRAYRINNPDIKHLMIEGSIRNAPEIVMDKSSVNMFQAWNNQLAFAGLETGGVTFKGYNAPNSAWFTANLYEADNVLNATTLTEDVTSTYTDLSLYGGILEGDYIGNFNNFTNKAEFAFCELVIQVPKPDRFNRLVSKLSRQMVSCQVIMVDNVGARTSVMIDDVDENITYDFIEEQSNTLTEIIFRYIGSGSYTSGITLYEPFGVTVYNANRPNIDQRGDQKMYGYLDVTDLKINGNSTTSKNTTGTTINLALNDVYNAASGDTKNAITYTIQNPTVNNIARCFVKWTQTQINAFTNEIPAFTGFTVIKSSASETPVADTEMQMLIWCDDDTSGSEIIRVKIESI